MEQIIIEPQFLPSIEYFTRFHMAQKVLLDIHHHYEKQTYRNRCYIRGANKVERLTVPVSAGNYTAFKDVRINYASDWSRIMWRSVESAYSNAPFYLFYFEKFQKILFSKPSYLLDLDLQFLTLCLELLNIEVDLALTEKYLENPGPAISDLRSVVTPKKRYSQRSFYHPEAYPQLFGSNFDANLSVIDLIFCEGPNAQSIVTKSSKPE